MSASTISCPSCAAPVTAEPTAVVREGEAALQQLFAGTLNRVQCPSCQREFVLNTPIAYRDDDARYLIYFIPDTAPNQLDTALAAVSQIYESSFDELDDSEKPRCRLTIDRREFLEKIALHRRGFDDRLIEFLKFQVFRHTSEVHPEQFELYFDFGESNDEAINFLAFRRETGRPQMSLGVPAEDYNRVKDHFADHSKAAKELDDVFRGYYVHVSDILQSNWS